MPSGGVDEPSVLPPPPKKPRSSLFASYTKATVSMAVAQPAPLRCTLQAYIEASTSPNATVKTMLQNEQFKALRQFVSSMYCVPATSAPVERVFSHGGIFMRPHRARMSDSVLCSLVLAKCNAHL